MRIVSFILFLTLFAVTAVAQEAKPIVEATGALERVLDDKGSMDIYIKLADAAALAPTITEVTATGMIARNSVPSSSFCRMDWAPKRLRTAMG